MGLGRLFSYQAGGRETKLKTLDPSSVALQKDPVAASEDQNEKVKCLYRHGLALQALIAL